jgi:hypothetical protein
LAKSGWGLKLAGAFHEKSKMQIKGKKNRPTAVLPIDQLTKEMNGYPEIRGDEEFPEPSDWEKRRVVGSRAERVFAQVFWRLHGHGLRDERKNAGGAGEKEIEIEKEIGK